MIDVLKGCAIFVAVVLIFGILIFAASEERDEDARQIERATGCKVVRAREAPGRCSPIELLPGRYATRAWLCCPPERP